MFNLNKKEIIEIKLEIKKNTLKELENRSIKYPLTFLHDIQQLKLEIKQIEQKLKQLNQ